MRSPRADLLIKSPPADLLIKSPPADLLTKLSEVARVSNKPGSSAEMLSVITHATRDCIPGVDAVSITVKHRDTGRFETLASTDQLACDGDTAQYAFNEGPCVDAAQGNQLVYSGRVSFDPRYRRYGGRAADLGVVSQLACQIYSADQIFGGLNLYSRSNDVFDEDARSLAELFAHQAAAAMGHASIVRQLNEALESRKVIGQALGMISERYGVDENRAFALLTRLSQTRNVKLRTVAAEFVEKGNSVVTGMAS